MEAQERRRELLIHQANQQEGGSSCSYSTSLHESV
jgi:hypothetical protein